MDSIPDIQLGGMPDFGEPVKTDGNATTNFINLYCLGKGHDFSDGSVCSRCGMTLEVTNG